MKKRLEELNAECTRCIEYAQKNFEFIDHENCARYCPIGQEIRRLEEMSSSEWNKVDWNSSIFEEYYPG